MVLCNLKQIKVMGGDLMLAVPQLRSMTSIDLALATFNSCQRVRPRVVIAGS